MACLKDGKAHQAVFIVAGGALRPQVFHTRMKHSVVIHPTSVFASDPEVLQVPEDEVRELGNASLLLRGSLSVL